jgi:hypothetical protein
VRIVLVVVAVAADVLSRFVVEDVDDDNVVVDHDYN